MLSKTSIETLAKVSGLSVDVLTDAINKEEEVNVDVTTSKYFTNKEWETFESSIDRENKAKYDEGKEVAQKQLIRDLKEKEGLNYEGRDSETFLQKFKEKVLSDADKNPDAKVVALENDLKILRDQTIPGLEQIANESQNQLLGFKRRSKILTNLPETLPSGLTKDDALLIIENNLEFGNEDGIDFVKRNGEVLKNEKTRENLSYKEVISDFSNERGWVTREGGKGAGDEGHKSGLFDINKVRKMSELNEHFEKEGINPKSQQAMTIISKADKSASEAGEELDYEN